MEILLGTNAECSRNFSHGIISTFYWIFSYGKNFKLLRKDSDPSYLRVGILFFLSTITHLNKNFKVFECNFLYNITFNLYKFCILQTRVFLFYTTDEKFSFSTMELLCAIFSSYTKYIFLCSFTSYERS
jgi:hypothetical protein